MKNYITFALLFLLYSLGYSKDFWVKTNGPYGADINSILINEKTNDIFLATKSDGVYISTNRGNSWESTNDGFLKSRTQVNDILLDDEILYATTDSLGILKKLPYQNWKTINSGMGGFLSFKTIIKIDNKTFIAGSKGKAIFKTTNSGNNWYNLNTGLKVDESVNCLYKLHNNSILLGSKNGIFLSKNNAKSWVNKKDDIGNVYQIIEVSDRIYVCSDSGVYISNDTGENWNEANNGLNEILPILSITSDGTNLYIVIKNKGIFKSEIGQINWESINNGLETLKIKTLKINKNNNELIAGTDCSVYIFNKEYNQWIASDYGLGKRTINSIINLDNQGSILLSTDLGVYKTTNNGYSWQTINKGFGDILKINCLLKVNDTLIIAGTQGDGLYFSNSEMQWQKIDNPDFTSTIVNTLNLDSSGFIYAGTDGKGIFKSEDNGLSWYQMFGGNINNSFITSMVITKDNTIFAGTRKKGLFKKTDMIDWRILKNIGYGVSEITALNISLDSNNNQIIYTGTGVGLKKSIDGGNNWFNANGFYPENIPGKIEAIYSDTRGNIYCGLKNINGVYISSNAGEKWERILDRSGIVGYSIISFNLSQNGYLYAGSKNGGCYRSLLKIIGENKKPIPPKLSLIGDSAFCRGGFAILDAGGGYLSYNWSNGITTRFDTISTSGTYWVRVKDSLQINLVSDSININVYEIPKKPIISYNGINFICDVIAASYQWYFNNEIISGANEKEYTPELEGWYKCEVISENNCKNISDSIEYKKPISVSNEYLQNNVFVIYPNPNSGSFILEFENHKSIRTEVIINDLLGNTVYRNHLNIKDKIRINSNLQSGIYFLRIITPMLVFNKKLIVR